MQQRQCALRDSWATRQAVCKPLGVHALLPAQPSRCPYSVIPPLQATRGGPAGPSNRGPPSSSQPNDSYRRPFRRPDRSQPSQPGPSFYDPDPEASRPPSWVSEPSTDRVRHSERELAWRSGRGGPLRQPDPEPGNEDSWAGRASSGGGGPQGPPGWNPVDVVKREQGLQSNRLPAALRESVEAAIEALGGRVTVGDVAARAGVKLSQADDALKALAYDTLAALEVSSAGDVVYAFPRGFKAALQSKSLLLSATPVLRQARKVIAYLTRVLFGTALVASIAVVWLAVAAILSAGDRDRNDQRGGRGLGSGPTYYNEYYGSYQGGGFGPRLFFNLTDLLIYLDPNYGAVAQERLARGAELTFVEAIFSFVFGDGDPNTQFDEQRWAALGALIQQRGGVVTAEEMAPLLEPPAPDAQAMAAGQSAFADESFVLPALIRFGGEPFVDESTGALLYRFPALQTSSITQEVLRAPLQQSSPVAVAPAEEADWQLTAARPGQVAGAVVLGLANLVGVAVLGSLLVDPQARYVLAVQGLGWVNGLMPALAAYAVSFFAIPSLRWVLDQRRNADIRARNDARQSAARVLARGGRWLQQKLGLARAAGEKRTVRRSDIVYSSDKDTGAQSTTGAEMSSWDKRMRDRGVQ